MQVHLALPGLLWPAKALPDVMFDLELPALAWLLGRARRRLSAAENVETWLARQFGHGAGQAPLAALRLLGEDDAAAPGDADWICADPAHLAFEQGQPMLADPAGLDLAPDEIDELAAALAPILAPAGEFRLHRSGRGYLRLAAASDVVAPPPTAAVGRGAALLLPQGSDATHWLRLANEAQIALHALELNRRREAAGRPVVNTLWFWGAGRLRAESGTPPCARVGAGDTAAPLARGLARHAGMPWQAPGADWSGAEPTLFVDDSLLPPAQQLDAAAWRDALQALDRERLAPLAAELRRGRIRRLRLTGLGDEATLDLELTPVDAWRFWRRPRTLIEVLTT